MTETKKVVTVKHKTMVSALLEFQKDMPVVALNGKNPHFASKFTTLAELTKTIIPKLNEVGIASYTCSRVTEDGTLISVSKLIHESGEELVIEFPIKETMPQKIGSALTYFRRYGLAALSGVVADEDDDGNAASEVTRPQPRSLKQTKTATANDGIKAAQDKVKAWTAGDEDRRKLANDTHTRLKAEYSGVELWEAIKKELGV